MNIFFLDNDEQLNAQWHCDKHVVKMPLEATQMVSTCFRIHYMGDLPWWFYKISYKNHPMSIWVRTSIQNCMYACRYGIELCHEYSYRYNKTHACEEILKYALLHVDGLDIIKEAFTEPPRCMPKQYCIGSTVVHDYRAYYRSKQDTIIMKWKNRKKPYWLG